MTIDFDNLVINVDQDVPRVKRRSPRKDIESDPRTKQLRAMELGDSFFIEGGARKDCRSLIAFGKKLGVFLQARDVLVDEVYQCEGVRLWRVEEHEVVRGAKAPVSTPAPAPEPTPDAVDDDEDF